MILDWTNWTFWLIALALVAFGFCLRDIYQQWPPRNVRRAVRNEFREVDDLTRRLQAATERLNKANADAEAAGHNFYKVEKWSRGWLRVELMLFAGSSLDKARRIFERTAKHWPRTRLTIRQRMRVLDEWPRHETIL